MRASVALVAFLFLICGCRSKPELADHYYGLLPCEHCEGISFELSVFPGQKYKSSSLIYGNNGTAEIDSGSLEFINEDLIVLHSVNGSKLHFHFNNGSLELCDSVGKRLSSAGSEIGVLKQVDSNWHPEEIQSLKPAFKASGNEPFWSLEIFPGKELILKTLDETHPDLHAQWVEPIRQTDLNAITFESSTSFGVMTVNIVRQDCQDTMSDVSSAYGVGISLGNDISAPDFHYTGCGKWEGIYGITGNWLFLGFDRETLFQNDRDPIFLSLRPIEAEISGHLGCNKTFGDLHLKDDSIAIGVLATTRMMCPDKMEMEEKLLNILSETSFLPLIKDSVLILRNQSHELRLRKMD